MCKHGLNMCIKKKKECPATLKCFYIFIQHFISNTVNETSQSPLERIWNWVAVMPFRSRRKRAELREPESEDPLKFWPWHFLAIWPWEKPLLTVCLTFTQADQSLAIIFSYLCEKKWANTRTYGATNRKEWRKWLSICWCGSVGRHHCVHWNMLVQFPVKAYARVVGWIPGRERAGGSSLVFHSPTMFLSPPTNLSCPSKIQFKKSMIKKLDSLNKG